MATKEKNTLGGLKRGNSKIFTKIKSSNFLKGAVNEGMVIIQRNVEYSQSVCFVLTSVMLLLF